MSSQRRGDFYNFLQAIVKNCLKLPSRKSRSRRSIYRTGWNSPHIRMHISTLWACMHNVVDILSFYFHFHKFTRSCRHRRQIYCYCAYYAL